VVVVEKKEEEEEEENGGRRGWVRVGCPSECGRRWKFNDGPRIMSGIHESSSEYIYERLENRRRSSLERVIHIHVRPTLAHVPLEKLSTSRLVLVGNGESANNTVHRTGEETPLKKRSH
jgi:hypothetical protein